ncbi:MAG: lipoate--protein ligase family protein [Promethearchaeota archaeon]
MTNSEKDLWRLLPFKVSDGFTNMAIDEAILQARSEDLVPNTIRFFRWDPSTATIGRNQSLSLEIDVEAAKRLDVDVVRRISGGGAVYHDNNNEITYSVVVSNADLKKIFRNLEKKSGDSGKKFFDVSRSYDAIIHGLMNGINKIGANCVDQGIIHCPVMMINDRKISGNAQARRNSVILQHGTILLYVDAELMYTILKAPKGVTKGKIVRSVKAKVAGLYDDKNITPLSDKEFQKKMINGFEEALHIKCETGELIEKELELIEEYKKTRYCKKEWLEKIP